jgi:rhodanese-related sulfurtransferase
MTQKDIKGLFLLLFFAVTTAFLFNFFSPFGIAILGQWETSKGVVTAISKTDSVEASIEINNPVVIKQIVQKKERIILDARPRDIYNQGHLPSALSFPLMDFDDNIGQLLSSINRQSAILVYCSSFECTDSHTFATRLKNLKFIDVKVFSGGFRQWQEMGYEIEKNEK